MWVLRGAIENYCTDTKTNTFTEKTKMLPLPISRDCETADCCSDCKERCCTDRKIVKIPHAMYYK